MASKILSALKDGTNQTERRIPSLPPGYVKPDNRDIPDLLKFIFELSSQFNYYNFSNQIDGDWSDLLKSDPNTLITLISKLDIRETGKKYERLKLLIKRSGNEKEIIFYFNDLLEMVGEIALFLVQLLEKAAHTAHRNSIVKDFSIILNNCLGEVNKLRYCNLHAKELFGNNFKINPRLATGLPDNQPVYTEKDIFGESVDTTEKISQAITFIDDILSGLKSKLGHLAGIAGYYLKNNDLLSRQYDPHIGLIISFLHLYTHLQDQLNSFTTKHLNFYYNDLLGIKPRSSHPDSVHLLFESNTTPHPVQLQAGTGLIAKVEGKEQPVIYALEGGLVVDKAQIAELKTIFVSDTALFSADNEGGDLNALQVYSGNYPIAGPGTFSGDHVPVSSWPILGEDQNDLPQNERTMEDTAIGIIIGSPLLYLPGGERTIQLTFKFEKEGFEDFNRFISNFAKKSGRSEDAVIIEMLSDAFTADYTTQDGWQPVKYPDTKTSGDNSITISFTLGYQDKGIDICKPAMPDKHEQNPLPLIRLLLNNETSHNPFSFLRNLLLDQLTLKVAVKGFRDVKLQNNIGVLSSESPFQIFGPQPSVGAYLNIKNSNVFNRFTKDFTVRLNWLNLPQEPGGFKSYYEGYGTALDNNSFRVGVSALSNGRFIPEPEIQQNFQLFKTKITKEGAEDLAETTVIRGIDFKKIGFSNEMSLTQEKKSEIQFKEGTVKITLDSPPEGFGHNLFPQIFPKVLLHNSKRFNKALPIPGQPFIPSVKSLSMDYTLEHTELFKGNPGGSDTASRVQLIHQYPFGFDAIYPGDSRHSYSFMPVFNYPSNLYIGIKDLSPGTELSLLFKLEEKNYHYYTENKSNPVSWSYLYQRTWVSMKTEDIVQDTTNNFINTGIIRLRIPHLISNGNNTMLNPDLYWLRASTRFKTDIRSRVIAIYAHAARATRVLDESREGADTLQLPPDSIKGFVKKVPGIQNIRQPFSSFGGKEAEGEILYRTRVSERLRHKQRPVTMQDIEQFILDEYPHILMAKCLGPGDEGHSAFPGTDLQIILIPKEQADGQLISDEPKVNLATLYQVKQSLLPLLSPFIKVEVGNPVYEKVKIVCKVKFKETIGFDEGFYMQELNKDIKKYICSWQYESAASLKIGTTIYLSDMHNYIKNLHYVSVVTGFSMVHFFKVRDIQTGEYKAAIIDSAVDKVKFIRGSVPNAVLIPDSNHLITLVQDFKYTDPSETGIGNLPVGSKLLVSPKRQNTHPINNEPDNTKPEEHFRFIINHH